MEFLLKSKPIITLFVALLALLLFIYLCKKFKLNKKQLLLFILFVVFWSSIVIIRSYRKTYMMGLPETGGLGLDETLAVSVVSIYGLISIFVRLPIFALSDFFKSRKFFIMLSLIFICISSVVVYINPNYTSMLLSSLAIGIGASLISLFNVTFAETFDKVDAIKSVSILSIAPLLAEFLVAPVQYIFTSNTIIEYSTLWLISAILALVACISLLFFKEEKKEKRNFSKLKILEVIKNKYFWYICVLGVISSFIKFSTSGTNFVALIKLDTIKMSSLGIAYADVIFSFFQLIAGVLVGTYLKKKFGTRKTMSIGFISSILFTLIVFTVKNPIILFISYALNGFSYGIIYNMLIGLAMQPFDKSYREITMGIFQTFFAIGIYYGDKIYKIVYNLISTKDLYYSYTRVYGIVTIFTSIVFISYLIISKYDKTKFLEK